MRPCRRRLRRSSRCGRTRTAATFPFVDFGGKKVLPSAQYLFTPLQNLPFATVAAQVGNNSTAIGANIDASAAQVIRTICGSLSDSQPAAVCSAVNSG